VELATTLLPPRPVAEPINKKKKTNEWPRNREEDKSSMRWTVY
jgi:hypothetical protein